MTGWAADVAPVSLRVMTFNTMCDFCGKAEEHGSFKKRLDAIADTIKRSDPDLISLQEIRTGGQAKEILARIPVKYVAIFPQNFFFSYPESLLLIRESRFEVGTTGGYWLGPRSPGLTFGWTWGIPRRVQFAEVKDRLNGADFIFVGAHFDNKTANREASARFLLEKFGKSDRPVIFAGDTNLRPDRAGYIALREKFRDTFTEVTVHPHIANGPTKPEDGCNMAKADTYPECRVDHVLVSKRAPWKTKSWRPDTYKYFGTKGFVSDHRAVVVDLEYSPLPKAKN